MLRTALAPWILAPLVVAACGDDEPPSSTVPEPRSITVRFAATADGEPVGCGTTLTGMGETAAEITVRDFRLYVSNPRLVDASGEEVPLALEDDAWQTSGVALLDFEDGSAACESGTAETNTTVRGEAVVDEVRGLRFDIGLPFALNHVDVSAASTPSPLNSTTMYWVWRGGYKFIRIDLGVGQDNAPFNLHLGSNGCSSPSPQAPPTEPCGRPNVVSVALDDFDPDTSTVELDLAALLAGADLTANTPESPPGCQSAPTEPQDCGPIFENLGLSFDTGRCTDGCAGQTFVATR